MEGRRRGEERKDEDWIRKKGRWQERDESRVEERKEEEWRCEEKGAMAEEKRGEQRVERIKDWSGRKRQVDVRRDERKREGEAR